MGTSAYVCGGGNAGRSMAAGAAVALALAATAVAAGPAAGQDWRGWDNTARLPMALAVSDQQAFNIPAQPLASALTRFGQQSGLQVSADGALVRDRESMGISGTMNAEEALARLLAGSGLAYSRSSDATIIVQPVTAQHGENGAQELRQITLEGQGAEGEDDGRRSEAEDAPFTRPGSDAFISREQIERIQPSSPGDIFREVPGVLSGASNDGTSINVNIRSSSGLNRVRTMVEGTQQESSGYQGYLGADQRTYIDPELIGGVEVSKGPGGGPYGTGTTSGVVNVRLLDADDLVQEGRNTGFRMRGGLGGNAVAPRFLSFEEGFNRRGTDTGLVQNGNSVFSKDNWFGSFAGAYRDDHFELVAAYTRRREGNYFAGRYGSETFTRFRQSSQGLVPVESRFSPIQDGQEVPNTSEDTESILLKGTLRFHDGQSLEAGFTRYDSAFGQVYPSSILLWTPQQWNLNEVESNRFWLRYKWESASDLIDLQANVWGTMADELGEDRQAPQENDGWGAEIWNASFVQTPLGGLSLTYGAEYSTSEALVDSPTFRSGTRYVPGQRPRFIQERVSPAFDGKREVYGGYLNAVLEPAHWLTLNAGLRYDGFNADSTSNIFDCDVDFSETDALFARYSEARREAFRADTAEEFNRLIAIANALLAELNAAQRRLDGFCGYDQQESKKQGDRISPRFGVTVEPLQGLQLFAQYAEGFRAPSLVEMGQTVFGPVTVNPDLEPEVVNTWEFGVNVLRDGLLLNNDAFRAKLVYFNNYYESYVVRTGTLDSRQGGSVFFYENVPDVTVSGYEASVYYDVGWAFANLNVNVFEEPFNLPTQASIDQPEYAGTLTLGTRWFDERLVLGGRVTFFGEPNFDLADPNPTFTSYYWAAEEIFDLFGSYQVNDTLALRFSVENVADTYYLAPIYVSRLPAPGRTVRASVTATF